MSDCSARTSIASSPNPETKDMTMGGKDAFGAANVATEPGGGAA